MTFSHPLFLSLSDSSLRSLHQLFTPATDLISLLILFLFMSLFFLLLLLLAYILTLSSVHQDRVLHEIHIPGRNPGMRIGAPLFHQASCRKPFFVHEGFCIRLAISTVIILYRIKGPGGPGIKAFFAI